MSKNNFRGITLGIRPIWGAHSVILIFSSFSHLAIVRFRTVGGSCIFFTTCNVNRYSWQADNRARIDFSPQLSVLEINRIVA